MAAVLVLAGCGAGGDGGTAGDVGTPGSAAPETGLSGVGTSTGAVPESDASGAAPPEENASLSPSATGAPSAAGDGVPLDDEASLRLLERRVTTRVVDAFDHDSWICTGESSRVEYRLADDDGARRGTELDGEGRATATTFGWVAIGADTLLLDYADVGRQLELGSILFADDDAFRANDGENGPLECRLQRYVGGEPTRDVSVAAAGDVNRDVEAAAALVERIETRRGDDGAFDHWSCDVADERTTGYVFAGPGVLDTEPRAVTFDVLSGTVAGGRRFRWSATDGTTLVLVPLDADVASADDRPETASLDAIVFPVDDAFTARRADDALLQCLRDGDA